MCYLTAVVQIGMLASTSSSCKLLNTALTQSVQYIVDSIHPLYAVWLDVSGGSLKKMKMFCLVFVQLELEVKVTGTYFL
ncbi:hypothetical protein GDO81_026828 [Engystomops pustulosus]|uniref:Secreted protein n=1 Tax=Engystomops pustulosus TaxID=76066 RepID=A0AAV6Z2H3_ENGPU|nr:hypothetical protein GDO81_026828 [Engystomops pustulosus]